MTPQGPFKLMSHVLLIDVHFRSFYVPVVSWRTLQCTSHSQMHFMFWAFWAEEYSIKGWQLGALPGWHRSCLRLAHCLATPMNIYCTSCYLCSMLHMLTFSPASKFLWWSCSMLEVAIVKDKHKPPFCLYKLRRQMTSPAVTYLSAFSAHCYGKSQHLINIKYMFILKE